MKYYTDGYTEIRNPSETGGGFTIMTEYEELLVTRRIEKQGLTNNEAELRGVVQCLRDCLPESTISTDSQNTISWLSSKKKCKARPDLQGLIDEGKYLKIDKKVNIIWEGRDFNLAGIYNEEQLLDTANGNR